MYTHHSIMFEIAQDRRRDMLAEAARGRLGRQARLLARASAPRPSRRSARHFARQLRPQAQS